MATRAQIARFSGPTEIETIYNHYDGYPSYLGKALKDHFNNQDAVIKLMDGGNIRGIDSETGETEEYGEKSSFVKADDMGSLLGKYADWVDSSGGNYAYIWDGNSWHTIENKGIGSMIQQLNKKFFKDEDLGVDLSEGWERKWENFIMENIDQDKLVTNIKVLLQDEIPEQVDAYLESVLRDIKRGDISQYTEMDDDDIMEDFKEYIADKLSS
jgi:hypothetical protein